MKNQQNKEFGPWDFLILILSVYVLIDLSLGIFLHFSKGTYRILQWSDFIVCSFFFADFIRRLIMAESKLHYLRWGWIDLISSIPTIPFFQWGRAIQVIRILRILRGARSVKEILYFVYRNKAMGTSMSAIIIAFVLMISCAIAILKTEHSPDSNIKTPSDALWWTMSTMTTVGYGDKYPVTNEGRVVGVILMVCGVGIFGILSGAIASWFIHDEADAKDKEQYKETLELIRQEVAELKAVIVSLNRNNSNNQ